MACADKKHAQNQTLKPRCPLVLAALAGSLLSLTACGAVPDPADYGGGAKGAVIAKCVSRTERADSAVTREQAGEMCTCIRDKMSSSMSGGGAPSQQTLVRCATNAGITID